jgi:hypothetical protein
LAEALVVPAALAGAATQAIWGVLAFEQSLHDGGEPLLWLLVELAVRVGGESGVDQFDIQQI